jgi:G:T/U-mismatch repair DNA glycosylase
MIFDYSDNSFYKLYYHLKERETTMAKKKKKIRKGNFIARLQRTPKVRSVKAKIRKHKAAGKRLSSEYRKALKSAAKKLR